MSKLIIAQKFTNKQNKERLSILGISTDNESGGIAHFENLDYEKLRELVTKGYADVDDKQNEAPTLGQFLQFMQKFPEFKAHGYVVSNDRRDRRISIEGLEGNTQDGVALDEFEDFCGNADEFECQNGHCRSWWD